MQSGLFAGATFLEPRQDSLSDCVADLVDDGLFKKAFDWPIRTQSATCIDLPGRALMPGLIEPHTHPVPTQANLHLLADTPLTLLAATCSVAKRAIMLGRRFGKHAL
jgi:cytosine/adenosine deaminase-related metal-dependent hydrolase